MASPQDDKISSLTQGQGLFARQQHTHTGLNAEDVGAYAKKIETYITKVKSMAAVREEAFYNHAITQLQQLDNRMNHVLNDDVNHDTHTVGLA